jgi:hypothetical protein
VNVGNAYVRWHNTPEIFKEPTAQEILDAMPALDPVIDEQIAAEKRLMAFRRKWQPEKLAAAHFDNAVREELKADYEAL